MDTSKFSNPENLSGLWFKIHVEAVNAVTDELKRVFEININNDCNTFKCTKCKEHFRKFIDTHPFNDYWNIKNKEGKDIGIFQWSWELHNQVNKHLNKYQPTLEEAYNFYVTDIGTCHNCTNKNGTLRSFPMAKVKPVESNKVKIDKIHIVVPIEDNKAPSILSR